MLLSLLSLCVCACLKFSYNIPFQAATWGDGQVNLLHGSSLATPASLFSCPVNIGNTRLPNHDLRRSCQNCLCSNFPDWWRGSEHCWLNSVQHKASEVTRTTDDTQVVYHAFHVH